MKFVLLFIVIPVPKLQSTEVFQIRPDDRAPRNLNERKNKETVRVSVSVTAPLAANLRLLALCHTTSRRQWAVRSTRHGFAQSSANLATTSLLRLCRCPVFTPSASC